MQAQMYQNSNRRFNNRIKLKFNYKIYIKIMRCKIERFQKFMWRNMMRSTKSQKASVLHYSIDYNLNPQTKFLTPLSRLAMEL
jgi:hypothetical protein